MENDKKLEDQTKKFAEAKEAREIRETSCIMALEKSRAQGVSPITMTSVVDGLKFIAEHKDMNQEDFTNGLLDLGCNFDLNDVKEQFPGEILLLEGMKKADLACGASIISNARDSKVGHDFINDKFLTNDDDISIYHFVRNATGDETYTKSNVEAQKDFSTIPNMHK
jgi:hypothetical protein